MILAPLLALLLACSTDPEAFPVVHFDHEACDGCGMLVGDPAHAAAVVTRDGETLAFDDPACLFRYVVESGPPVAHMWFADGETWYNESQVAFVADAMTPMGSGLRVVPKGTAGAMSVGEASARVMASGGRAP